MNLCAGAGTCRGADLCSRSYRPLITACAGQPRCSSRCPGCLGTTYDAHRYPLHCMKHAYCRHAQLSNAKSAPVHMCECALQVTGVSLGAILGWCGCSSVIVCKDVYMTVTFYCWPADLYSARQGLRELSPGLPV